MSIVRPMMRSLMRMGKLTPGGGAAYDVHPNLVLDMPFSGNLRDYISGQYLTLNRSGELAYLGKDGTYKTAPADHPAIGMYGVFHDGAGTQYFVNPHDPVTQTINLGSTGNYCLWVSGSGSATVVANSATIDAGGEATDGSYVTFEVTDTGTVDITIDGDPDWCQLEDGTFPSSRIYNDGTPGDGSTSSRATQSADSSGNGLRIPLDDLDPRVLACLGGEGAPLGGELEETLDFTDGWKDLNENLEVTENQISKNSEEENSGFLHKQLSNREGKAWRIHIKGTATCDFLLRDYDVTATKLYIQKGDFDVIFYEDMASNDKPIALNIPKENTGTITVDELSIRQIQPVNTLLFTWRPEFDYDVISAGTYGLIGFNGEADSGLYIDEAGNIIVSDGTNTITHSVQWSKGDSIKIALVYESDTMKIRTSINDATWTETSGDFDGQIPHNDNLRLFFDFEFPSWLGPLKQYDQALSNDRINQEANK